MGFKDLLNFDEDTYIRKISLSPYPDEKLRDNIYRKRREIYSASWGIGAGIGAAFLTGGASLAGTCYSLRKRSIANQKLTILEGEWRKRGYQQLRSRKRDIATPVIVGCIMTGISFGVADCLAHAGAEAVNQAASSGVHNMAADVINTATNATPSPGIGSGLGHGAMEGAKETFQALGGHHFNTSIPYLPGGSIDPASYSVGFESGVKMTTKGVEGLLQLGINAGAEQVVEKVSHMTSESDSRTKSAKQK